ncbi:MAG: hypothetical protein PUK40_06355 [Actinomycetaceae bacterium]|nr:hypothetical protein [Actinomycetaceae bacterium]
MPVWFTLETAEMIAWGAGFLTIIGGFYIKKVHPVLKEIQAIAQSAAETAKDTKAEIKNNHGSSKGDAIDRTEAMVREVKNEVRKFGDEQMKYALTQQHQSEMIGSLGHQIGELITNSNTVHTMTNARLNGFDNRLAKLENTSPPAC